MKDILIFKKKYIIFLWMVILLLPNIYACSHKSEKAAENIQYQVIDGEKYSLKQNLKIYLLLGTDIDGNLADFRENQDSSDGQSDVIEILVLDTKKNTYARMVIDRNTMVSFNIYDENGDEGEDSYGQICLAYGQGYDGTEQSCKNVADSLDTLLYDIPFDGYVSLSADAISDINHMLGGVTVTIEDDFENMDPTMKKGEKIKLSDQQANTFCRSRQGLKDSTNENRMKRQEQYISAAIPLFLKNYFKNPDYLSECYEALQGKIYTNISRHDMIDIAKTFLIGTDAGCYTMEGSDTHNNETNNTEFQPDQEQLDEIVIKLFFEKAD